MLTETKNAPESAATDAEGENRNTNHHGGEPAMSSVSETTDNIETWIMPSGRRGTIDLSQNLAGVDSLRRTLREAGAVPVAEADAAPVQCPEHDWCDINHADPANTPGLHRKTFERGAVRFDFFVDDLDDDNPVYLSWCDSFDEEFTPATLYELNTLAASIIVGKAAFELFVAEVTQ